MDQNNQPPKTEEEKLIQAPPEERLIDPPVEEQLLPEHVQSPKKGGMMKIFLIILGVLVILALAVTAYLSMNQKTVEPLPEPSVPSETETPPGKDNTLPPRTNLDTPSTESGDQVLCTMDAKVCPDGSSVGRQGPDCEFSACPGE